MWRPIIKASLDELDAFLRQERWHGRENEIVNLYAHHFLTRQISPQGPLTEASQIGIEVAVPQITGSRKKMVRKDLVIWPTPLMTAWSPGAVPSVIIEWKRDDWMATRRDIEWLATFTRISPTTLGFAVCAVIREPRGIYYTEIKTGEITEQRHPANGLPLALHTVADA